MAPPLKKRRRAMEGPSLDAHAGEGSTVPVKSRKPAEHDSESGDVDVVEKRLRFVDVLTEVPNGDAAAATELVLSGKGLTEVESLESCRNLRKLELKDNHLSELSFLEMNHQLCWLGVAKNRLERIAGLDNLASLAVLDLSDNRLCRLEGLAGLSGLKALIVARNRISRIEGLSPKRNPLLETLVLSHNQISECHMAPFPVLKKLSLAQNQFHAFPGLETLPQLTELRLNGNRISSLTKDIARQPRLSILDVGNNLLDQAEALLPLKGLLWIKSLNLFGNRVAQDMENDLVKGILATLQRLEIINNRRVPQAASNPRKLAKERNKGRRRHTQHDSRASETTVKAVAPKAVAVHGRSFAGKRSVFADDSDHEAGSQGNQRRNGGKAKRKKRKLSENAPPASAGAANQVVVDASTQLEPTKPRRVKKKVKRRKNQSA